MATTAAPTPRIRHEWFQTDTHVTVSVFIKNVDPATLTVDMAARSLSLHIRPSAASSETVVDFDPLAHPILPSESKVEVLKTKIEVSLKKERIGLRWGDLEGTEEERLQEGGVAAMLASPSVGTSAAAGSSPAAVAGAKPSYPSSSRKKHDWNEIERGVEEDKPEGEQALNALFQQIFKDANEDTRRAMMKSYVESNGTCLSTNWDEVGKKKVEVTPPEGMVAKKFEV
ncbi:SGS domain-containing protein [Entophlyctis helioformis]|nr:SGS domain-containing protein [Entophlyctis helioformis]